MSLQDNLFAEDAEEDVQQFLKSDKRKRVLLFPPVNNYRRFLIHQLVQDRYSNLLQTFSIGQGFGRRTVICYKSDFIRLPQVNGVSPQGSDGISWKSSNAMGIESQCTPTASPEHSAQKARQVKSAPAVEIYRPPAARRARLEKSPAESPPVEQTSDACARANRQKRPDRAVYVPRHRRSGPEVEKNNAAPMQEPKSKSPRETFRADSRSSAGRIGKDRVAPLEAYDTAVEKMEDQTITKEIINSVTDAVEDQAHIKPILMALESPPSKEDDQIISSETPMMIDSIPEKINNQSVFNDTVMVINSMPEIMDNVKSENALAPIDCSMSTTQEQEAEPDCLEENDKRDRRKSTEKDEDVAKNVHESESKCETENENKTALSTTVTESCNPTDSCNGETVSQEPKSVSSPEMFMNESHNERNNEDVIKKTLISDVLIISTKNKSNKTTEKSLVEVVPMTPPEKRVKKVERPKSKPAPPPLPPSKLNREECDWDSLFDDNGDCLDPTLIEELTSSVGEVVIEKPKSSYKTYTKSIEVSSDEFGHVLEIYNFPSDFKSGDLSAVFSPFKSGGFELKWVDDTHCLGVFSSPLVAAEVLASEHPFVKTRPLSEATALSKTKARRSSEFLQPYRTRPETCAALARRLVTKSLGVKLATARQEREQEKIVLREAKEKKRLANKQREDIWEGIVTDKPTT